jgi:hypothetical protein
MDMIDFETLAAEQEKKFRPTDEQVEYVKEYLAESGLGSLLVAVDFPGKLRGLWFEDQERHAIMDGGLPAIWVDRDSAMDAFDKGLAGNAIFRVYADGHVHLVDEV